MHRLGTETDEIENPPRVLPIRHRIRFKGVNEIGKFDGIPNEENLQVVSEIPIAVFGVKLDRETARIA